MAWQERNMCVCVCMCKEREREREHTIVTKCYQLVKQGKDKGYRGIHHTSSSGCPTAGDTKFEAQGPGVARDGPGESLPAPGATTFF